MGRRLFCLLALIVVVSLGAGCAPKQPQTPEEIAAERTRQMQMVTRVYPDKKPEEVLLAASRIFALADDDYIVSHTPTAIHAQRRWMLYLVISAAMGTDTWVVETYPEGNGTKVIARHSGQGSSVMAGPAMTMGGDVGVTALTTPSMQHMTVSPALYQLFFARLDYFMGKRTDWMTCKEGRAAFKDGILDPFCTVANDRTPDGKSSAQRRASEEQSKPESGVSIGG